MKRVNGIKIQAGILLGMAVSFFAVFPAMAADTVKLPRGLSVGDQELSGLTEEEAKEKIKDSIRVLSEQKVCLDIEGEGAETTAKELGLFWSNEEAMDEAVSSYKDSSLVKRYLMSADLAQNPVSVPLEVDVSEEKVQKFVEENGKNLQNIGQDASITRENGVFIITPETPGKEVDTEATREAVRQEIKAGVKENTEEISVKAVIREHQPQITEADLQTIQDVLGSFSTDFSSSGSARSTNLSVGAAKINGHVLMPGETLSGYECLHPFTSENGYRSAAAYENGQVVDSIGGGVCQIATTLYNASLLAELEITQRQNHSMIVTYVRPSQDAAIAGTYKDIKVTNPYSTPVYVEGYTEGRTLTFTIYGQETRPENREIHFESETLSTVSPGAPREIVNPSMAPGSRRQVQSAHRGLRSRLWKVVTVDGVETERNILSTDTYNASPAVVQVGPPAPVLPVLPVQPEIVQPGAETQPVPETSPSISESLPQNPAEPAVEETQPSVQETIPTIPETQPLPETIQENLPAAQPSSSTEETLPSIQETVPIIPDTQPASTQPAVQEPVLPAPSEEISIIIPASEDAGQMP